ncbi:M23 family metallopeptidase [Leptolyngbya sp. FACHB-261]|uniref:M23 family metallopeptidase n=1 Tax=Leptolyngbya sp. FACHB-261 TaxID=2692806 RepID=UPI0016857E6E|nr:M23 family metallopeptidase [Leptolyngbya sp. FACHB-261]MBD2102026.1 peptidoglycan DD-metalloendopeptidase family protein [Leptolyngbya sp. FACHB-261]
MLNLFHLRRCANRRYWSTLALTGIVTSSIAALVSPLPAQSQRVPASTWRHASFPVDNFRGYSSLFGHRSSPFHADSGGPVNSEFHSGLDIAAPRGSYVRSWWGGQVESVISDNRCGTGLVVRSGGWKHTYCHMEGTVLTANGRAYLEDPEGRVRTWDGQVVQTGQPIGRVGMSGRTTGPHLHWGLSYNGRRIDPAVVLRAMYGQRRR